MAYSMFTGTELELLLERARSRQTAAGASASNPHAETFDFRRAGQLSSNQITRLLDAHTEFANQLSKSLSALLGAECVVTPSVVAQIAYADLIQQFSEGVCFGTLHIQVPEGHALVQSDLATALPMVDLMLGGAGLPSEEIRPLTEIEVEVFKPVIELFAAQLQAAWAPLLETSIRVEHYGMAANLYPANERVLLVKFQVQMGELQGTWTLILPQAVCNALTPEIEEQLAKAEAVPTEQNQFRLKEKLLDSRFRVELYLPPTTVAVRKLANLKPGQIVVLKARSSDPIHLNIAGINLFHASPVSCGTRRGAQIKRSLSIVKREIKEKR